MRKPATTSKLAHAAAALLTITLCIAQPARAGDGGADFGSLQAFITNNVCPFLGMNSCPQLPTLTQAVLQLAGLANAPPEMVRSFSSVALGNHVDAANPSRPPGVSQISGFPVDPSVLSTLNPLAFSAASSSTGSATATRLYDPAATIFLYAVGSTSISGAAQPDTLLLFYDDPSWTSTSVSAQISLPLTVLNSDRTERPVAATLQYQSPKTGAAPCSASSITANFSGSGIKARKPADIGVNCTVIFAASPASPFAHAIFEVAVPLLITATTDPGYSVSAPAISLLLTPAFSSDDTGFAPATGILGNAGKSIGIAPTAGPLGAASATVPATYALCAKLPTGKSGGTLVPAIAAFYAIATDGEVLLSTPLVPVAPGIVCSF